MSKQRITNAFSSHSFVFHAVWGPATLEENMAWLAESLGTKATETPDESIRRYLADKFFKDHCSTRQFTWLRLPHDECESQWDRND